MSQDKKFFDSYSVIIGAVVVALVVVVLAMNTLDMGQGMDASEAEEYRAAVAERIRPFGEVYLPGEETEPSRPIVEPAVEPEPVATAMSGPQVYNTACLACHGPGIGGAPIFGDSAAWAPRIAKGIESLNEHALNGFTDVGYMPPKGGRVDLSDPEILDAVAYMVDEVQ